MCHDQNESAASLRGGGVFVLQRYFSKLGMDAIFRHDQRTPLVEFIGRSFPETYLAHPGTQKVPQPEEPPHA
jgi:hypothetical protein